MEFQSTQYTIDQVVQRVRSGRLALPDFQREFVWNPARVVELLDSVARQWPIGSLLLLNGPQPFAVRPIDSAPPITGQRLDTYILDGQQRITALYHAITDSSDICYYIDFQSLFSGDDNYIKWEKRSAFLKLNSTVNARAANSVVLVSELWEFESFYRWLELVPASFDRAAALSLRERKLGGLQSKVYKVVAIELEQEIELEALARIFETLNRTGVRLNAFDLMVAALYPSGFHLRDAWDSAMRSTPILQKMDPDALEVLKLLALLLRAENGSKVAKGVRQGDLLAIDRDLIRLGWDRALALYVRALEYAYENFGVISESVVPSWSMILGVAAWISQPDIDHVKIKDWWVNRLVSQFYAQAANTRAVSDFEDIFGGIYLRLIPGVEPSAVTAQPARRNGLLMRGIGALLIQKGARDFMTGEPITYGPISFRVVDPEIGLKMPGAQDSLQSIVVLTEASEKRLPRTMPIGSFGAIQFDALASQGLRAPAFARTDDFLFNVAGL